MSISVKRLKARRDALDRKIQETQEANELAERRRKAENQARFILGGLILKQDRISDKVRDLLVEAAVRRRPSDQAGWTAIAEKWGISLSVSAPTASSDSAQIGSLPDAS